MIDYLFEGIDNLTKTVETRNHAIDIYNDFAIKYNVKHKPVDKELLYKTFYRWVNIYKRK